MRKHLTPGRLALAAILLGAFAMRLYGLEHGLPFIYHSDESQHFTRYAVEMFDGDMNPIPAAAESDYALKLDPKNPGITPKITFDLSNPWSTEITEKLLLFFALGCFKKIRIKVPASMGFVYQAACGQ